VSVKNLPIAESVTQPEKIAYFLKQFEFVGINVCPNGNQPAMSKHQLLHHWPSPIIVRNIAKFVGFMQF
jgi:hypothetical protein